MYVLSAHQPSSKLNQGDALMVETSDLPDTTNLPSARLVLLQSEAQSRHYYANAPAWARALTVDLRSIVPEIPFATVEHDYAGWIAGVATTLDELPRGVLATYAWTDIELEDMRVFAKARGMDALVRRFDPFSFRLFGVVLDDRAEATEWTIFARSLLVPLQFNSGTFTGIQACTFRHLSQITRRFATVAK
jgi:hypothetical protein